MERGYANQQALATAAGVDQKTISRMERLPGPYHLATVEAVAHALGVEMAALRQSHDDEITAADADIALEAVLQGYGRTMGERARRKFARAVIAAMQTLLDGEATVKSGKQHALGVRLLG